MHVYLTPIANKQSIVCGFFVTLVVTILIVVHVNSPPTIAVVELYV